MGTTCANIHIWKANEADVRPHIGISHTLSSFSDHWISILSDDLITDGPYVARRLSRSIDQPVLFVSLYDSERLTFLLFTHGRLCAEYHSGSEAERPLFKRLSSFIDPLDLHQMPRGQMTARIRQIAQIYDLDIQIPLWEELFGVALCVDSAMLSREDPACFSRQREDTRFRALQAVQKQLRPVRNQTRCIMRQMLSGAYSFQWQPYLSQRTHFYRLTHVPGSLVLHEKGKARPFCFYQWEKEHFLPVVSIPAPSPMDSTLHLFWQDGMVYISTPEHHNRLFASVREATQFDQTHPWGEAMQTTVYNTEGAPCRTLHFPDDLTLCHVFDNGDFLRSGFTWSGQPAPTFQARLVRQRPDGSVCWDRRSPFPYDDHLFIHNRFLYHLQPTQLVCMDTNGVEQARFAPDLDIHPACSMVYAWEDVLYWSFCTHNKAEWTGAFVFKLSSSLQPMAQWYIPCEQPVSLRVCADGRQILGCCTTGLEKGTLFVLDLATGDARHTDVPAGLSLQTQDQCIDRYGHVYLTEGQSTLWVYDRALQPIGRHRLKGRILQIVGQTQGAYVITHSPQASQMSPCVRVYEVLAP